ncbi:unnamed protein product [Citrullus colocynthis]|uniref:Gnk2-homologous domain-containing protein n=1 Tax=Citrullus colocynthis TaxID=252529 RepID=A0ABP0YP40_9ROSI
MGTPGKLLFFCSILIFMVSTTISQIEVKTHSCSNTGNYTTNSIYNQNLPTLLSSITSNTQIDYVFYNFSAGQQPDKFNAIALCLADLTLEKCRSCLQNSTRRILEDCPNQKEAKESTKDRIALGDSAEEINNVETIQFDFETIKIATDDFASENKLGQGGFGAVYKVSTKERNAINNSGYMTPEYAMHGQFSAKSDVFSFGILVLEIVGGWKNNCFRKGEKVEDLSSFAWKNWRAGTTSHVIDPTLNVGSQIEMMRCIHIGLLCVQENPTKRPTMASVVLMLSSFSLTLPIPSEPTFFIHSKIDETRTLSNPSCWLEANDYGSTSLQPSTKEITSTGELHPR